MLIASSLALILGIFVREIESNNFKCSKVTTEPEAHPSYPSFGGICTTVNGQLKFEVKFCSFPRNNISITEGHAVQKAGLSYEYRCLFSEEKVYQQITGCVIENQILQNGQIFEATNGRSFVCIREGAEWYLDEIQRIESVLCKEDQDARGVRFSCRDGKLEAIGCIDTFGLTDKVLKDGERLEFGGYYSFICLKDSALGFKLQVAGCLDTKKQLIPIGQSVTEQNVTISCEVSTSGQIVRQEKLAEGNSGCFYYGFNYKEGEEFHDSGNFTVYKCEQGQLKKIACIVKTNRVNVDRIFYCFDHPYYCAPTGTGVSLLQNNGCFNNGVLVKATRKVEKPGASFVCSRGPFDPETQTYTFTQSLTACIIDGNTVNLHQYAKVGGKWMYCDESRNMNVYAELRELSPAEKMCADKYGEQMSFFCVPPQNKEVNPDLADQSFAESSSKISTAHFDVSTKEIITNLGYTVSTKSVYTHQPGSTHLAMQTLQILANGYSDESASEKPTVSPFKSEKTLFSESPRADYLGGSLSEDKLRTSTNNTINSTEIISSDIEEFGKNSSIRFESVPVVTFPQLALKDILNTPRAPIVSSNNDALNGQEAQAISASTIIAKLESFGYKCENGGEPKAKYQFEPSQLTEEEKKEKYTDMLDSNMCKMLSGYCLDWVEAEATFQLSPDQISLKPLVRALMRGKTINSVLAAVEKIGKTNQFKLLNDQNYHMRRIFNFTLFRLSNPESECRLFLTQCFEGLSEGCTLFSKANCVVNNPCPLTGSFDSVNSQPLIVLKPLVRHLCAYTCAQWLSTIDNEQAAMKSAIMLAQYSEKCMV